MGKNPVYPLSMVFPVVTTLAEAQDAIRELAEENEKLNDEVSCFKRQMFGSQIEHYVSEDDTPSLFPKRCCLNDRLSTWFS